VDLDPHSFPLLLQYRPGSETVKCVSLNNLEYFAIKLLLWLPSRHLLHLTRIVLELKYLSDLTHGALFPELGRRPLLDACFDKGVDLVAAIYSIDVLLQAFVKLNHIACVVSGHHGLSLWMAHSWGTGFVIDETALANVWSRMVSERIFHMGSWAHTRETWREFRV
jgi:hypothetical protein